MIITMGDCLIPKRDGIEVFYAERELFFLSFLSVNPFSLENWDRLYL